MNTPGASIQIVDDDPGYRSMLLGVLSARFQHVHAVASAEEALEALETSLPDLILLDMQMPGMGGLGLLRELNRRGIVVPTIVLTAFAEVEDAVEAMKLGALDYVRKPVELPDLFDLIRKHTSRSEVTEVDTSDLPPLPEGAVFESPLMGELLHEVARVASSEVPVLLVGESGCGKEVIAELLHAWSGRAERDLVRVNVSALPETLVEAELFGATRGAFTGADHNRSGLVEEADGGTLFLDEIGEMPLTSQPKLLTVLESGKVSRIGEHLERTVDFRLISATNRDLDQDVTAERFRLDLYYRLAVVTIEIPPLRERREDILPLAEMFVASQAGEHRRISQAARSLLLGHQWPGNIRELRNVMLRATILAPGDRILPEHLPPHLTTSSGSTPESGRDARTMAEIEKQAILEALSRCDGNRTQAARDLGISRRKLLYRLKDYGENAPDSND